MPTLTKVIRTVATFTALSALPIVVALGPAPAQAHGSMSTPLSRSATCYQEGPEAPQSAACQAAIAASGTQAFYDWHEVNIANAAGQHRQLIPDGKLCSAGREKYQGLDLPRADWPATTLTSGADYTFRFKGTAPHKGTFALYVTKAGYDPTQPLRWADLEAQPFLTATDPSMTDGDYVMSGQLPSRSGRHLIYSIWQRSDSSEAFYSCSDIDFGGGDEPEPRQVVQPPNAVTAPQQSDHKHDDSAPPATTARQQSNGKLAATGVMPTTATAVGLSLLGLGAGIVIALRRRYLARHLR